jgi:hypothetical protein
MYQLALTLALLATILLLLLLHVASAVPCCCCCLLPSQRHLQQKVAPHAVLYRVLVVTYC